MVVETCAESIDLSNLGIAHGKCIDGELIEKIIGYQIINKDRRDANREYCGCMQCIDIGQYNTCVHSCEYCFANANRKYILENWEKHDPDSELLIGKVDEEKVNFRKGIKSFRVENKPEQMEFKY